MELLSRANRGDASTFSMVAYLLLSVVSILIAVGVMVTLYNIFFTKSATDQDAAQLAKTIEKMLNDNGETRLYDQQSLLIRTNGNIIVGFDPGVNTIEMGAKIFTKESKCNNKGCICTADDAIKTCYPIEIPSGLNVRFYSDYFEYDGGQRVVYDQLDKTNEAPFRIAGEYSDLRQLPSISELTQQKYLQFVIYEDFMNWVYSNGKKSATGVKTTIPIALEKIRAEGSNTVAITLMPNTIKARARVFYGHVCMDKDTNGPCGFRSGYIAYFSTGGFCAKNAFDNACTLIPLQECEENKVINKPCTYRGEVKQYGMVAGGTYYDFSCETITKCDDYCTINGESDCQQDEYAICQNNPCKISNCQLTANTFSQGWSCKG